jgi:hypothetical protein
VLVTSLARLEVAVSMSLTSTLLHLETTTPGWLAPEALQALVAAMEPMVTTQRLMPVPLLLTVGKAD